MHTLVGKALDLHFGSRGEHPSCVLPHAYTYYLASSDLLTASDLLNGGGASSTVLQQCFYARPVETSEHCQHKTACLADQLSILADDLS